MASKASHHHPNRHRKALRSALTLFGVGTVVWIAGLATIFAGSSMGIVVSLVVVGVTIMLLSPVWYFTYMENLEPELYQHDK
jgi:hypothetical protein